jgi:hypothetical protein
LRITNTHPELGLIEKRALGKFGEQPLETPERLLRFASRQEDFSFPKKGRIVKLGLGRAKALKRKQKKKNEDELPSVIPSKIQWE